MEAVAAAIVAVDVLGAFTILLLLALAGLTLGEALRWIWDAHHPPGRELPEDEARGQALMSGYCETHGKRRYPSRKEAKREHRRQGGKTPHFYQCEHGGWHVTTQSAELTAMHRMLELKEARGEASEKTVRRYQQRVRAAERRARDATAQEATEGA